MAVTLPADVQALVTPVANALLGTILGRERTAGDHRETMIAGAALEQCWHYVANPEIDRDILREAAIRLGGAMMGTRPHAHTSMVQDPSGTQMTLQSSSAATVNLMRASGASAALSPFKIRRGGTI